MVAAAIDARRVHERRETRHAHSGRIAEHGSLVIEI